MRGDGVLIRHVGVRRLVGLLGYPTQCIALAHLRELAARVFAARRLLEGIERSSDHWHRVLVDWEHLGVLLGIHRRRVVIQLLHSLHLLELLELLELHELLELLVLFWRHEWVRALNIWNAHVSLFLRLLGGASLRVPPRMLHLIVFLDPVQLLGEGLSLHFLFFDDLMLDTLVLLVHGLELLLRQAGQVHYQGGLPKLLVRLTGVDGVHGGRER